MADPTEKPSAERHADARVTEVTQVIEKLYQGPIPPSEDLERYKAVYEKAPQVLFGEFQAEAAHRRKQERQQLKLAARGQWFSFVLSLCSIVAAVGVTALKADWPATFVLGFAAVLFAGAGLLFKQRRTTE